MAHHCPQVPVLEVDGKMLAQSGAIERYAAKLAGLYPSDEWELAKVEEVVHFVTVRTVQVQGTRSATAAAGSGAATTRHAGVTSHPSAPRPAGGWRPAAHHVRHPGPGRQDQGAAGASRQAGRATQPWRE